MLSLAALLICSSCSIPVYSSVTSFHQLPQIGATHSYSFLPNKEQKGSLEYSSYCEKISAHFTAYGWHLNETVDSSTDYLVAVSYGIDDGKVVSGSVPLFGQTGGGTAFSSGSIRTSSGTTANYQSTTTEPITFGQVGSIPYNTKEFNRHLLLTIIDARKSHGEDVIKVYEGRVLSSGSTGEISVILPIMIDALFKTFPGASGKTVNVSLPLK